MNPSIKKDKLSRKGAFMEDLNYLVRLAIVAIYAVLFGTSAWEKIKSLTVPDWFLQQFTKSFLGPYPQIIKLSYWKITLLETVLFLGFAGSLIFPTLLLYSLISALFLFAALCFGLRISYDFQGSANMFTYFAATLIAIKFIS